MSPHKHRGTGPTRRLATEAGRSLAKLVAGPAGGQRSDDSDPPVLSAQATGVDPWSALPPPATPRTRPRP